MIGPGARLLAVIVARIGDTVLATPVLRALRGAVPEGSLDVIAHPKRIDVLEHLPFVDRLVPAAGARLLLERLKRRKPYDHAFVFGNDARLFKHAFAVASRVTGFRQADERINAKLAPLAERPQALEHAVVERMRLARATGIDSPDLRMAYHALPEERADAERFVAGLFPQRPRPLVAVVPKSFATKAYRDWPVERFTDLFTRLFAACPEAGVVLLGDAAARGVADALMAKLGKRVASAAGQRSLRESAALIAVADAYVGVDTGPTHIAGALDVPMVALYHCAHRGRHLAPLQHSRLEVVEHPCPDEGCSDAVPMAEIDAQVVWRQLQRVLASTGECAQV
jgi:heptosyltransferase-3